MLYLIKEHFLINFIFFSLYKSMKLSIKLNKLISIFCYEFLVNFFNYFLNNIKLSWFF